MIEQVLNVRVLTVLIGGGRLISGIVTAVKAYDESIRVVGIQAESAATALQSPVKGHSAENETPDTTADGIATGSISNFTLEIIQNYVDDVVTVTDTEIAQTTLWLLECTRQMIEEATATSVVSLLSGATNYHCLLARRSPTPAPSE